MEQFNMNSIEAELQIDIRTKIGVGSLEAIGGATKRQPFAKYMTYLVSRLSLRYGRTLASKFYMSYHKFRQSRERNERWCVRL